VVQYHVYDSHQVPYCWTRAQFYGSIADGVPWFAYDGLFDAWPYGTYETKLQQRMAIPTDVTMRVGAVELRANEIEIQIEACLEEGAGELDVRLYAVIVEDHYPNPPSYSRNTFRLETGTSDVTLEQGTCHYETRNVTLDPNWVESNLEIIAWAQTPLPSYPALVHQACKDPWPFDPLGPEVCVGDANCDGQIGFNDINAFVDAVVKGIYCDGTGANADMTQDDPINVGFEDINPFVDLVVDNTLPLPCP
jgi:hypothetical protein